jgi:hypothetical protein
MKENETDSSTPVEIINCIGVSKKPDGSYEILVFQLEDAKITSMETTKASDKVDALDSFKIMAQRKVLGPLVRGD